MKINWQKVWLAFDQWTESRDSKTCKTCHHTTHEYPDWDEQQRKIERLVNAQMRPTRREESMPNTREERK